MEEQTNEQTTDWLKDEAAQINVHDDYDELPSVQFEENKIAKLKVDFTSPFNKWSGKQGTKDVTKAIIPCTQDDVKKNLWLNVKNPLYSDIVKRGADGQTEFSIMQVGTQANTKYNIVEE
jgi:hypothetical protein